MAADLRPRLRRPARVGARPSLTPLVDVLLILVVFFLVTSTYLSLASLPMIEADAALPAEAAQDGTETAGPRALLLRLSADGSVRLRGRSLDAGGVAAAVRAAPGAEVLVLPSPAAQAQALVSLMEAVAAGGGARLKVIRVEDAP